MSTAATPRIAILLTASIDPKGMSLTRRADPRVREADYLSAIDFYKKEGNWPIVVCENSGWDLSHVRAALENGDVISANPPHEVLQFDGQLFPRNLGKGYGELLIIRHALEHSKLLAQADYILKITGRYQVKNLSALLKPLSERTDVFVFADYKKGNRQTSTAVLAARPEFLRDYLAPLQGQIDDSKSQTLEVAFNKAIEKAVADGKVCAAFPERPLVAGISGTWNVRIDPADYNRIVFSWPRLKGMVRAYAKAIVRRVKGIFGK